jgi:subtilisin family serine protease
LRLESLEARVLLAAAVLDAGNVESETQYSALGKFGGKFKKLRGQDAGNNITGATSLGTLSGTVVINETVGGANDPSDVFRFDVAKESDVTLKLSNMKRDLNLKLMDEAGVTLATSAKKKNSTETIVMRLPAGAYFVEVMPATNQNSSYRLQIDVVAVPDSGSGSDPGTGDGGDTGGTDPSGPSTSGPPLAEVPTYGGSNDWNLNMIGAPESWAVGFEGAGVIVAVVDSGVDLSHTDLQANLWVNAKEVAGNGKDDDGNGFIDDVQGWDFVDRDNSPTDANGHGTHVAGTIGAVKNGAGATGVAYASTIMPIRVLDSTGSGWTTDVAAGIRYAVDNGARVVNLSIGGGYDSSIESAIQYAWSKNVFVAAAAGNDSASLPTYPARHSATLANLISVGAHNSSSSRPSWSNLVGTSGAVQVDAPGVSVYSTTRGGGYGTKSGTSMATPHVAGLAALTLSAAPNLTAAWVRDLIVAGAKRVISGSDSVGGIDARYTVAWAAQWAAGGGTSSGSSFNGGSGGGDSGSGGGSTGQSVSLASATTSIVVGTATSVAPTSTSFSTEQVSSRSMLTDPQEDEAFSIAMQSDDELDRIAMELAEAVQKENTSDRLFAVAGLVEELLLA